MIGLMSASVSGDIHDVLLYVLSALALAAILLVIRLVWRGAKALGKIDRYVIPHFEPPTQDEIRDGAEDNTLPTRMRAMEVRLTQHLDDEELAAGQLYERIGRIEAATLGGA